MKLDEKELDLLITSYTAKRRLARRYVYIEVSVTELATVLSLGGRGLVQYDKEGNVLHVRATRNAVVLLRKHYRRELIDYWVSHQLPIGIITDVMRNLTFKELPMYLTYPNDHVRKRAQILLVRFANGTYT